MREPALNGRILLIDIAGPASPNYRFSPASAVFLLAWPVFASDKCFVVRWKIISIRGLSRQGGTDSGFIFCMTNQNGKYSKAALHILEKLTYSFPEDHEVMIGLPNRFVAPSVCDGIFSKDQFYWDSYFIILGLPFRPNRPGQGHGGQFRVFAKAVRVYSQPEPVFQPGHFPAAVSIFHGE